MSSKKTVVLTCRGCGTHFAVEPWRRNKARCCSRRCLWEWYHKKNPEDRFWKHVKKSKDPDGCWLWTASTSGGGYGTFNIGGGVMWPAHRFSYTRFVGPIPDSLWVLHRCDVKGCVRPDHLFPGTPKDNTEDAAKKGILPSGERQWNHRLTWKAIVDIRRRYAEGGVTQRVLALEYGVHSVTIGDVIRNKTWKVLEETYDNLSTVRQSR